MIEVVVKDVVYPGKALCEREDGKKIFCDEGLDGEKLLVDIVKEHPKYDEATIVKVIEPSSYRASPKCMHYRLCSVYQVMDYAYQIRIKLRQLANIMKGIFSHKRIKAITSDKIWHYRNKMHLHWESDSIGYKDGLGKIIDIDKCFLIDDRINEVFGQIKEKLCKSAGAGELILRSGKEGVGLYLKLLSDVDIEDWEWILDIDSVTGAVVEGENEKIVLGCDWLSEDICGVNIKFGLDTFFQVNVSVFEEIVECLKKMVIDADSRLVLELFCGVGVIGISLSSLIRKCYAIEVERSCERFLKENSLNNQFGNFFYRIGSSGKLVWEVFEDKKIISKLDTVIVDPPRSGLSKSVREFLRKSRIRNLFYLSCDPMTLRRDLLHLKSVYKVEDVIFFDMFPHTPHIETLVYLKRRKLR